MKTEPELSVQAEGHTVIGRHCEDVPPRSQKTSSDELLSEPASSARSEHPDSENVDDATFTVTDCVPHCAALVFTQDCVPRLQFCQDGRRTHPVVAEHVPIEPTQDFGIFELGNTEDHES